MKNSFKILVTGANGQLGTELKTIAEKNLGIQFTFVDKDILDITNNDSVKQYFKENSFDYCINTAAYTAVDLAEKEKELAFKVNAKAVLYLSEACFIHNVKLIQISTDFVFDGKGKTPYLETDEANL